MTTTHDLDELGYNFIPPEYLPEGEDEYYQRDRQSAGGPYRDLSDEEVIRLKANANFAHNWGDVKVAEGFNTDLVQGSRFYGLVRIGRLERNYLAFHDLKVPVGVYDSTVISCDLGNNVSVMKVGYLSHYIVGDATIISQADEIACSNHSKFGNGTIKQGEDEDVRVWLELGNENGGRSVLAFEGMSSADAYLWYKYRDNTALMQRFRGMTDRQVDPARGYYGTIGRGVVIKSCRIIKDVKIGDCAYIKGANKLKNLTIASNEAEPTQIGEGVELVNGIIEPGCRIFYGVKAVRFYLAAHASLKYGARLINSFLGENSTISCCEVLNSLLFPFHEQHHNNSFLCAARISGQSNMAAGATLGSNHNSRANDGELVAERGFWPGLCVSIKHSCRFASFTLLAKADYPAEMNIPLPFCLVSRDESRNRLVIMPAYWFNHNMYALARNAWKFPARDHRAVRKLHLETDYLAPDTAEEMFTAIAFLEKHTGLDQGTEPAGVEPTGAGWNHPTSEDEPVLLPAGLVEKSRQPVLMLKPRTARATYRSMLHLYAVKSLVQWLEGQMTKPGDSAATLMAHLAGATRRPWVNCGGQLIPDDKLRALVDDIESGGLDSWDAVHSRYRQYADEYAEDRARHAYASLRELHGLPDEGPSPEQWEQYVDDAVLTAKTIATAVRTSRTKDYVDPFRAITYDSEAEMQSVMGNIEGNGFIRQAEEDAKQFAQAAGSLR